MLVLKGLVGLHRTVQLQLGPKNKEREEGGDPRTEEQRKPRGNEMQEWRTTP